MQDGMGQEVQIACDGPSHFRLIVSVEETTTSFTMCGCDLGGALAGREVSLEAPGGSCRLRSADEVLEFVIRTSHDIGFSMKIKQLEVLARRIGFQDET